MAARRRNGSVSSRSGSLDGFDPFKIFEVSYNPCSVLYVRVIRGRDITKGKYGDMMDTPDPYVILHVKKAPNCYQRTVTKDNNVNPEWNETFKFYLDPREESDLEVTLMDGNYLYPDEMLGKPVVLQFKELPYDDNIEKTLQFNETSKVDIEMWAQYGCEPQLRFSLTLCDEERAFIERRKKKVMESMYDLLGEDAPRNSHEVPTIGIIGSGGGFRAMSAYSGVWTALVNSRIMEMVMFAAGLSGSAWYIAQLYSHPDFPSRTPGDLQAELGKNIEHSPVRLLGLSSVYNYIKRICEKRKQGQPISFTDLFGHLVGETLLKNRDEPRLTDQQAILKKADVPLPLYTCLHVKKHISAMVFHEWMEFSPYEIGLPKYGTFLKPQLFGGKFFMGQLVKQYQEPPLHFLLGVWGSAFCIQFNRLLKDDKRVKESEEVEAERTELEKELVQDMDCQSSEDSETSESEMDDSGERNILRKRDLKHKKDKPPQEVPFWTDVLGKFFSKNQLLKTIEGRAAKVHSFMRGLSMNKAYPFSPFTSISQDELTDRFSFGNSHQFKGIFDMYPTTMKKLYVVDGGLTFNSPYPLLLRPQRQVDIILSFDFSARPSDSSPPFKEILLAKEWAELNNVPFPPVDPRVFDREGMKECYVFEDPDDPHCPIVLHFVLVNITFRDELLPGQPRTTKEEKAFADFDIFDDPDKPYSTFNFKYGKLSFDRLTKLMEFNTLMFQELILRKIKECVVRKREDYAKGNGPIKVADIKKLRDGNRKDEEKLANSVASFKLDGVHFDNGRAVGTVTSHSITEASGIASSRRHRDIIYTHNDSGGQNRIFAVSTTDGSRKATIYIDGAHSHDWEDIAVGPCADNGGESCIYIGDTGGNAGGEANRIYRVREPSYIGDQHIHLDSTLMFSWNQHDCETLMVDNHGEVYLVSKRHNAHGYVFHVPKYAWGTGRNVYLTGGVHLPINTGDYGPVGGDISVSGREVLLKTYGHVYYWSVPDGNYLSAMAHYPQQLPYRGERQGEAVCWDPHDGGYYTLSEGGYSKLYYYKRDG